MNNQETLTLVRNCDAYLIPSGTPVVLREGEQVFLLQSLGGAFTVNINGNLARVAGQDADALGLEPPADPIKDQLVNKELVGDGSVDETLVWEQLKTCYDPEIPVNIVELGLIYTCDITALPEGGNKVSIEMTLTAVGCGMGPILVQDVEQKVANVPNVTQVQVELVFDPPWDMSMMSEAAQLQLGVL